MSFHQYKYDNSPLLLPLNVESDPDVDWDTTVAAAGFNPGDEEVSICTLSATWNGHPAGSLVVTGLAVEGHRFAVAGT